MKKNKNYLSIILGLLIILAFIKIVISIPTFGSNFGSTSFSSEDQNPLFVYDFNANVSETGSPNPDTPWTFSIYQINSSFFPSQQGSGFYSSWISLSSAGILTINSTNESMCGRYNISVSVVGASANGEQRSFYFIVNASNDYPNITLINNSYNISSNVSFTRYVNGSDEERHYPLRFNLSFYNNCTKYPWNNRTNCDLFNFVNTTNTSALMNYTANKYDAGVYWANVTVTDFGENYTCISGYCLANYSQNRTYFYPAVIQFNVYPYLEVNATNCSNLIFQENRSNSCTINISSRGFGDNITYTSNATLGIYPGRVSNSSWFFKNGTNFTNNYTLSILINITPQKDAIGNWTINFSARDVNFSEFNFHRFNITVNRTQNDVPRIATIPNVNSSTDLSFRVNVTVYDDDNIIPDKYTYNETIRFLINITNQSNTSESFNFSAFNFTVQIINYSISGTNRTEGKIELTPNSTMAGNFYVNVTAIDLNGANVTTVFNVTIKNNIAPQWNQTLNRTVTAYEHNITFLNLSQNITEINIDDTINFSYSLDSYFPSFKINQTTGIINFTANDSDVGFHIVTIIATDGFLTNSTTINFTILNVNETPVIRRPLTVTGTGSSGNSGTGMFVNEDASNTISMYVEDSDSGIITEQRSYYNESLSIRTITITGPNSSLFSFNSPVPAANNTNYTLFLTSAFTPSRSDVGVYSIFINVSDMTNRSDNIVFSLTIQSVSHTPNFTTLLNQSTGVNRTLYYRINASDLEDGSTTTNGNSNLTFRYTFLNGSDFINNNQTIFNITTGILNYTFNSSEAGRYRLNITVNDTGGLSNSSTFWVFVYNIPNVTSPASSYQYSNMVENQNYLLNFSINHSIQDNVTCEFYIESSNGSNVLRYNQSNFGNNTIFSWNFTSDYTNETYGVRNLTLITYPSTNSLSNATDFNITRRWNITINHTNAPLQLSNNIGGSNRTIYGGSPQQVILSDFFSDIDASDKYHNQTITFSYNAVSISGAIAVSVIDWINGTTPIMTFSSSGDAIANYTIIATEMNETNSSLGVSNVTSNVFTVELIYDESVVTVTTPSSGGGGGGTSSVPYALKIITPSKISGYAGDKMIIPLTLFNNGKETFRNINVTGLAFKDNNLENNIKISFDETNIASLGPGQKKNITMTVFFKTNKTGDYDITVYAISKNPSYTDWSKIYINLQKINESDVKKYVLFTEEYLVENPSCLELKERLKEADKSMESGNYATARAIAEDVLNSCKESVEQVSLPSKREDSNAGLLQYSIILTAIAVAAGIAYYYFKRRSYNHEKMIIKSFDNKSTEQKINK